MNMKKSVKSNSIIKDSPMSGEKAVEAPKRSYTYSTWHRLRTVCRAMRQTEGNVTKLKAELNSQFSDDEKRRDKMADVQSSRLLLVDYENSLEMAKKRVTNVKSRLVQSRLLKEQDESDRQSFEDSISLKREQLLERYQEYVSIRENLVLTSAMLVSRRKAMIQELRRYIFRIEQNCAPRKLQTTARKGPVCSCVQLNAICGLHLPNADILMGHNERELSAALGLLSDLLVILSRLVDIPLRYPIKMHPRFVRPIIIDTMARVSEENKSQYPLFQKGQNREAFEYGVYLLNKNIAQLRMDCGLLTTDLSRTLDNTSDLLIHLTNTNTFIPFNSSVLSPECHSRASSSNCSQLSSNASFSRVENQSLIKRRQEPINEQYNLEKANFESTQTCD